MKNARSISLIFTIAFAGQSFAQTSVRDIIQSNYNEISRLSIQRDKETLEKLARKNASSCFEYIDAMKNTLDLAATIRQNNEQLSRVVKFNSNSNKIIGMKQKGIDIVFTVKTDYDVFVDAAGKSRVVGTSISQDTWTKTLSGWKIKRSRIVKESSRMNGKPLN